MLAFYIFISFHKSYSDAGHTHIHFGICFLLIAHIFLLHSIKIMRNDIRRKAENRRKGMIWNKMKGSPKNIIVIIIPITSDYHRFTWLILLKREQQLYHAHTPYKSCWGLKCMMMWQKRPTHFHYCVIYRDRHFIFTVSFPADFPPPLI